MISIFGQWSGNGLGYFNPAIYETLGYTSSSMQLALNVVHSVVGAIGALTAVYYCDRMPRRTVLVWGTLGMPPQKPSYLILPTNNMQPAPSAWPSTPASPNP